MKRMRVLVPGRGREALELLMYTIIVKKEARGQMLEAGRRFKTDKGSAFGRCGRIAK
jgi:hypothetical protein